MKIKKNEYTQQREIRFTGLSRSGNHAIINWVINQLEGSYCFLNCTEPKHNPFLTARPLNKAGDVLQTNLANFDLQAEQKGNFSRKKHLLYSHEDCFLGPLQHKTFRENHDLWMGKSATFNDVLILRDPFNLFASRKKSGLMTGHYTHHGVRPISISILKRIYKQHAREFLGEKNLLKNKIVINYNRWTSSLEYRQQLAQQLEVPFTDSGFETVAAVAGGSSFDGTQLSGKASSMKLHSRWERYADNENFWELFDDEIMELSVKIFGPILPMEVRKKRRFPVAVSS